MAEADVPRAAQKGPQLGELLMSCLSPSHWGSTGAHSACLPILGKEREEWLLGLETFLTPPHHLTPPTPTTAQSFCVLDGGWGWALWGRGNGQVLTRCCELGAGTLAPSVAPKKFMALVGSLVHK